MSDNKQKQAAYAFKQAFTKHLQKLEGERGKTIKTVKGFTNNKKLSDILSSIDRVEDQMTTLREQYVKEAIVENTMFRNFKDHGDRHYRSSLDTETQTSLSSCGSRLSHATHCDRSALMAPVSPALLKALSASKPAKIVANVRISCSYMGSDLPLSHRAIQSACFQHHGLVLIGRGCRQSSPLPCGPLVGRS